MRPTASARRRRQYAAPRNGWLRTARPFPDGEPQDLRISLRPVVMEQQQAQNAETNGCDEVPIAMAVSNHTDASPQGSKAEKSGTKSLISKDGKTPRNTPGSSKKSRARRNTPVTPVNAFPSKPVSERRVTRHVMTSPSKTSLNERKTPKNSQTSPATNAHPNRKTVSSHSPNLSPTLSNASSTPDIICESVVITNTPKHRKRYSPNQTASSHSSHKRSAKNSSSASDSEGSPRASKRIRLQHQPFQSPPPPAIIPAILRQQVIKTPDDKICVFQRGEFLAVRNENGSFFVCRTAQNVYKSSKRFKIQWMSDQEPDIYIPDFYDQTDFECVLTNLRLKRVDKNKYQLPAEERQRTLNILQRALNVENGMDISKLQVTTDGVDVSIVGKEEEVLQLQKQQNLVKTEQKVKPSSSAQMRTRGRPRRAMEVRTSPKATTATRSATTTAPRRVKTLAARVKLRSKETVKVKLKKEGGKIIVSNKSGKPVPKLRKIVERLHPNSKVTVYEKDPTFEMSLPIPYVSSSAHSKLLIRAILLKDISMLQSLMKDTHRICSLDSNRSVDIHLTPLAYGVLEEDHRAIRALLSVPKKKYANPPETLLEHQANSRQNITMLGFAVRAVQACRGGREGNNAFLKDLSFCDNTYPEANDAVIKEALRAGVSIDTINVLFADNDNNSFRSWKKDEVLQHITVAIRHGHYKLAGQLVTEAVEKGGYGFGNLHKEVLTKERQQLTNFKAVSVIKKAIGKTNARITPLHCAAINPNPQYLASLLSVAPEYNLPDENGWRPIHYASVCKSTGTLELLISRGISLEEVDSEGNTPLHVAAIAGRAHNVDLILKHIVATDHGKKDVNATVATLDKFNIALVDRGNKKSFTPLHLACLNGHADVVRVLLRHKANVDKLTNAQQDKLTALMMASQKGHAAIVQLLIDRPARVEMKDKKQRTALTHSIINGHANIASHLLRLGANPNSTDSSGNTLVHFAAAYGWYFCMKLLIEAGASLNLPNDWKITPLSLAFMKGHMGLVDYLVEQPGIDINVDVNNDSGMTLVMQALRSKVNHSMLERIHFLVVKQNSDCTKVDFMGYNALHHLVMTEVEESKREMQLNDDSDDNNSNVSQRTTRTRSRNEGSDRSQSLQKNDNESDEGSDDSQTSQKKDKESVPDEIEVNPKKVAMEEEYKTRADMNNEEDGENEDSRVCPNAEQEELFKEEAQQEHDALVQEITKLLLDNKCSPMVKDKQGESPFNLAVREGCLLLVKMFLDAGCLLTLDVSSTGDNILHYLVTHACSRKVEPMLHAILNAKCSDSDSTPHQLLCKMAQMYNEKGHTPLLQALNTLKNCKKEESKNRLLTFTKFLIDELGADVSATCKDADGKELSSALHLATLCGGGRVIETLLAHKAPLNTLDADGQTPLILGIKNENIEAIEALVKAGAMVNIKSVSDGKLSPLLLASKSPKLGSVVQLLVHNRADVNDVDPKNKATALHYVVSVRAADVLETTKALLTAGADVNAINDQRRTPLHLAVNASSSDSDASYAVEECLIGFGASVDAVDCRGRTPLHYAFTKIGRAMESSPIDPVELIVLLLGAMPATAIEAPDHFGETLLHAATQRGATISFIHIAKHLKDLEVKDKNGNTALGLAVKNGHESCTLTLLQRGASCISDLVIVDKKMLFESSKPAHWQWEHVAKKPPVPIRRTILQEALLKDWQGILYLMLDQLDAMGKGINIAVEAALKTAKYNVALKLIGKVKHSWNLYTDKQSMLHVLAREAPSTHLPDLQVKVAQFLIEKGVPIMTRDEHGCSVLTYAAMNRNFTLCSFFSTKIGVATAAVLDPDKSSRTPLSAIFWRLEKEDLSEDMRNWCVSLLKAGASLNILSRFPLQDSPFPGVRCTTIDTQHLEDASATKISPLIVAIRKGNYSAVKFFISQGADVNFPDEQLMTPLMHAARLNDIRMVKLLLNNSYDPLKDKNPYSDKETGTFQKTSTLNLTARDVNGFTVMHHLVSPLPEYCYANCVLLRLLAEMGTPLDTASNAGETPLNLAIRLKRKSAVCVLQELLKVAPEEKVIIESLLAAEECKVNPPKWDYRADCKSFLDKIEQEKMAEDVPDFKPDPQSGLEDKGEVVIDTEKTLPYDVVLTVVDLNYGAYGIYNFYKMQIIKHKSKDFFVLFTAWGRVGDSGQNQRTPFNNLADVVKEFSKIFKTKTGNHWDDIKSFQPLPKKYRLVDLEKRKVVHRKSIKVDLESDVVACKLDQTLQDLLKEVMNIHSLEISLQGLGINTSFDVLPFGSLTENTLMAAENLLKQIAAAIKEKNSLPQNPKSQEKFSELMNKIVKLSEDFYQLLPVYGYQYESLSPLFSVHDVHQKLVLIHDLLHVGLASEMILAAYSRRHEINPKDYVYESLGCHLQQLDQNSQECQMILQYIHNTAKDTRVKVQCIHRIYQRDTDYENTNPTTNRTNQRFLLWHGTRVANILGILRRGLQAAPLGASITGQLYGKGVYLADMFAKSERYCHSYSSKRSCAFLCEAAIEEKGDVSPDKIDDVKVAENCENRQSTHVLGQYQPNPAQWVSWRGITVPLGEPVSTLEQNDSSNQHRFSNFSEYVVYKASDVRIRYLITFESC